MQNNKTGVVIMTYGSATTANHVKEYFEHIYHGKASSELIADFEERYRLVGGSPLITITKKQAQLTQEMLGASYIVRAGMRHSEPTIREAIAECKQNGADRLIGIVLSPQFSSIIMEGYRTSFVEGAFSEGFAADAIMLVGPWPKEVHFVHLLAERTQTALSALKEKYGRPVPVVFTTHSLPESVVAKDPHYLEQLQETISAVQALIPHEMMPEHYAAYQSAGHTPEPWLKPDLTDILDQVAGTSPAILIVPIQFLADHLEILYDLDIAGKEQCKERGVDYNRIELPNTDPLFIQTLAVLVKDSAEK